MNKETLAKARDKGLQKIKLPHPKAARKAKGLSGEALAKRAACSVSSVWTCEREGRYPSHAAVRANYLRALGLKEEA